MMFRPAKVCVPAATRYPSRTCCHRPSAPSRNGSRCRPPRLFMISALIVAGADAGGSAHGEAYEAQAWLPFGVPCAVTMTMAEEPVIGTVTLGFVPGVPASVPCRSWKSWCLLADVFRSERAQTRQSLRADGPLQTRRPCRPIGTLSARAPSAPRAPVDRPRRPDPGPGPWAGRAVRTSRPCGPAAPSHPPLGPADPGPAAPSARRALRTAAPAAPAHRPARTRGPVQHPRPRSQRLGARGPVSTRRPLWTGWTRRPGVPGGTRRHLAGPGDLPDPQARSDPPGQLGPSTPPRRSPFFTTSPGDAVGGRNDAFVDAAPMR